MAQNNKKMIAEAFAKRFNEINDYQKSMIFEFTSLHGGVDEDDPMAGAAAPADPAAAGAAPADPMAGAAPAAPAAAGADPMAGAAAPADPAAAGAAPADPNASAMPADTGFNPQPAADAQAPAEGESEGEDEDEEEVDVDDLTDAQEESEKHIKGVDAKLEKVMGMVDKLMSDIEANNQHLEAFKDDMRREMEKRNPTPQEQAAQRVNVSSPYNVNPDEFQPKIDAERSATPASQYTITQKDIDDVSDWANISKSLDSDDTLHYSLDEIFKK